MSIAATNASAAWLLDGDADTTRYSTVIVELTADPEVVAARRNGRNLVPSDHPESHGVLPSVAVADVWVGSRLRPFDDPAETSPVSADWLWLFGPPGVGKSATGFALYEKLSAQDRRVAFVEIDQIGICMPAPASVRSAAKAHNLLGLLETLGAAGADGVIVSGDIAETMTRVLERVPARPVLCRLRADDEITVDRLTRRGGLQWAMSSNDYESWAVPAGDLDIATDTLRVDEVADEIARRLGSWPPSRRAAGDGRTPTRSLQVDFCSTLLVTGPRVVGTSTVAWQVLMASMASGHRTAYLDLEQLSFLSIADQPARLGTIMANVAACAAGFRSQGAERLVLCGHLQHRELITLSQLMPSLRAATLTASPGTLLKRARQRSEHNETGLPGDDLYGSGDAYLREVLAQSDSFEHPDADVTINTDARPPRDIAAQVAQLWTTPSGISG